MSTLETVVLKNDPAAATPPFPHMARIGGGTFLMGSEDFYPEERPVHRVAVDAFWMDEHPVTNAQFHRFVEVCVTGPRQDRAKQLKHRHATSASAAWCGSGQGRNEHQRINNTTGLT